MPYIIGEQAKGGRPNEYAHVTLLSDAKRSLKTLRDEWKKEGRHFHVATPLQQITEAVLIEASPFNIKYLSGDDANDVVIWWTGDNPDDTD